MEKIKTVIQRNLDITKTYTIIGSSYVGMENGSCCDNCGRVIANVAEIECNETKRHYCVGMDCAETLSGIKGDFTFEYIHKANFNQAKQARTRLNKLIKIVNDKGLKYELKTGEFTDKKDNKPFGGFDFDCVPFNPNYRTWHYYEIEVWQNYVKPMIKDLVNA